MEINGKPITGSKAERTALATSARLMDALTREQFDALTQKNVSPLDVDLAQMLLKNARARFNEIRLQPGGHDERTLKQHGDVVAAGGRDSVRTEAMRELYWSVY